VDERIQTSDMNLPASCSATAKVVRDGHLANAGLAFFVIHFVRHRLKNCLAIWRTRALLAATLLTASFSAHATILWSQPGTILVHDNNDGEDILHGAIAPQGANSSRTLYLKLRIDPYSDAATEGISFYSCGLFFTKKALNISA